MSPASSRASSQASSRASQAEEPELERRLQAMEDARPTAALTPAQLVRDRVPLIAGSIDGPLGRPEPLDVGAVESAQLAAFEQGEPQWWLALGEGQRVNECALECAS